MAKIYLVRHCESEGNACRRTQAQVDSLVTHKGYEQIEMLRRRFAGVPIDAIYSSDSFRSVMTAEPIAKERGLKIHVRISLREITTGIWEDMAWGNIAKEYPEQNRVWNATPWDLITPGATSFRQVADNMTHSLRRIAQEVGEQGTALVVSHSCTIKSLLCSVLGKPLSQVKEFGHGDNTSVSLLNIDREGNITPEFMNDSSHLPPHLQRAWGGVAGADINMAVYPCDLTKQKDVLMELVRADAREREEKLDEGAWMKEVQELLTAHPNYIAICYLKDKPCGYVRLGTEEHLPQNCGYLERMYVVPALQGKGYGEQLFGYAAHCLRYTDHETIAIRKDCSIEEQRIISRFLFTDMPGHPAYRKMDLYCPPCPYPILA